MDETPPPLISPFPSAYRASGILLHVTSLPSLFGIGDLGPAAYHWIDQLAAAGQSWWQVLPLGPTGFGNCPYQLQSTFGANPLLISPELLHRDGLLEAADLTKSVHHHSGIDFTAVTALKQGLIARAWDRFRTARSSQLAADFERFRHDHREWLVDYAVFECLRARYQTGSFWKWPRPLARREPLALQQARQEFAEQIDILCFGQFLAWRQIEELKAYAQSRGIRLIGDLPFFTSPESSDVWVNPELFLLDPDLQPRAVAGVPPDYFSPTGQLWGNPVYDWKAIRQSGYQWWLRRIRALLRQVDVIRLDHFRGFAAAWHVPAGAASALEGAWQPGPGADFFHAVQHDLQCLPFLAEDLGEITDDVTALRDAFQLTGMRVLQFAFDGNPGNPFLPDNYVPNTVAYTATHDNDTTRGWYESLNTRERLIVKRMLRKQTLTCSTVAAELLRQCWESRAAVTIAPLQDLLNLGSEHRMNIPGQATGNWSWQLTSGMPRQSRLQWLLELTRDTQRSAQPAKIAD